MTEIVKATGNSMVPAYAAVITAIITLISLKFVKETKGLPLALE